MEKGAEETNGEKRRKDEYNQDGADEVNCMRNYEVAHKEIAKEMEGKAQNKAWEVNEVTPPNEEEKGDKTGKNLESRSGKMKP